MPVKPESRPNESYFDVVIAQLLAREYATVFNGLHTNTRAHARAHTHTLINTFIYSLLPLSVSDSDRVRFVEYVRRQCGRCVRLCQQAGTVCQKAVRVCQQTHVQTYVSRQFYSMQAACQRMSAGSYNMQAACQQAACQQAILRYAGSVHVSRQFYGMRTVCEQTYVSRQLHYAGLAGS